jgi:hypothetical protein
MATLFKDMTYTVEGLVREVERGDIALPEIQRPFVWNAAKVRDLFDSMYKGFPVGFLLFWETGAGSGVRQIGSGQAAPRLLIVDGQQRLTSLFAVMTGTEVLREDYSRARIRLAFRPADGTFEVTSAAIEKDAEFIPDISALWQQGNRRSTERQFLARLADRHGGALDDAERDRLADAIERLYNLKGYDFKVVALEPDVAVEQVADIFVRINSEGVTLNYADFILTLMSVFWEKGRTELEEFARACTTPSVSGPSPFNWFIQPKPDQLIRVTVALAFSRARLSDVYTVLRGRDVDTGQVDPDRRKDQFALLEQAQAQMMDLTNWHEFLSCLERAGFRGARMISSGNAILFTYAMWLFGRTRYGVPLDRLRELMARWFFMAHLTSRYSGTFESQGERDFARLRDLVYGDGDGFCKIIDQIIDDTLTSDFWTITLPNMLSTSAAKSPALLGYLAALNIHDADVLLSTTKVRFRLDPVVIAKKSIERHHLFPRKHLSRHLGISDVQQVNQIANFALVEWIDNIGISDRDPAEYWPSEVAKKPHLGADRLARQRYWHALPDGWEHMAYQEFLAARRPLLAKVVRDAFGLLRDPAYAPEYPVPAEPGPVANGRTRYGVSIGDLISAGLLEAGDILVNAGDGGNASARVLPDGQIEYDGDVYEKVSTAASQAKGGSAVNGWEYWQARTPQGLRTLAALREQYLTQTDALW